MKKKSQKTTMKQYRKSTRTTDRNYNKKFNAERKTKTKLCRFKETI